MTRPPLPRRWNADVAAGGVTVAFGVFFTVSALQIPSSTFANSVVQPQHLPVAIGIGLVLCGVALTLKGILANRGRGAGTVAVGTDDGSPPAAAVAAGGDDERAAPVLEEIPEPIENPRHLLVVAALLVAYLIAFEPLGFLVATILFLAAGTTYLQPRRVLRNVVYSLVLPVAVYLLFDVVLGIVLPPGILDWLL
jgi:putative tricarboxylic transport membrane protein